MTSSTLGQIATTFAGLSLLAIGGANAVLPEVHREVVDLMHWMDDATFAKVVAIAQTSPGPNLLVVSLVGWQIDGLAGLLVATFAITVPSTLLAIVAGRLLHRWSAHGAVAVVRRALAPLAVGLLLAGGAVIARAADQTCRSPSSPCCRAASWCSRALNPIWSIIAGALVGIAVHTVV